MSLVRPMKNSIITSAKPITVARSMTRSGTGLPAQFLDQAQKMWPPSSGRIGSRLIRPSERLTRASSSSAAVDADVDRLVGDVAGADDAGDLLALFLFEDAGEDEAVLLVTSQIESAAASTGGAGADVVRLAAVGEADQGPLVRRCRTRGGPRIVRTSPSRLTSQRDRGRRQAAVDLLAGAFVRRRPARRSVRARVPESRPAEATCRRPRAIWSPGCSTFAAGLSARISPDRLVDPAGR